MSSPAEPTGAPAGTLPPHDPAAANEDSCTPVAPPMWSAPGLSNLLTAGLITGITAALVSVIFYGIGSLFGTDFDVVPMGSDDPQHVQWWATIAAPIAAALLFALLCGLLLGRRHNRRIALVVGYVVGLASLAVPLIQPDEVTWPTRIWLALMHLVTMLIVVPNVARMLGDSDPYVTAGYRRTGPKGA
jgi:predicted secreted protein